MVGDGEDKFCYLSLCRTSVNDVPFAERGPCLLRFESQKLHGVDVVYRLQGGSAKNTDSVIFLKLVASPAQFFLCCCCSCGDIGVNDSDDSTPYIQPK
jgi:hypothetical protein